MISTIRILAPYLVTFSISFFSPLNLCPNKILKCNRYVGWLQTTCSQLCIASSWTNTGSRSSCCLRALPWVTTATPFWGGRLLQSTQINLLTRSWLVGTCHDLAASQGQPWLLRTRALSAPKASFLPPHWHGARVTSTPSSTVLPVDPERSLMRSGGGASVPSLAAVTVFKVTSETGKERWHSWDSSLHLKFI